MAKQLMIVADSQAKFFKQYLHKFADMGFEVNVNSVSGRRIQDVSSTVVEETRSNPDLIIHLGANHMSSHSSPSVIVNGMRHLVTQIVEVNPACRIHISSVLPRQRNDFDYGTEWQRCQSHYAEHLERLDRINSKAAVMNVLLRQEVSKFPGSCSFIDNDVIFIGRRGLVKRHLLSRDGLHLTPEGATALLGNMLLHVHNSLSVNSPSIPPPPPPSPPTVLPPLPTSLEPSAPMPSHTSSDTTLKECETSQSSVSSDIVIAPLILHGRMSYCEALLVPKPLEKCKPTIPTPNPIQDKMLAKPHSTSSKPQLLSTSSAPSKPDPYNTFQVIGKRGHIFPESVNSNLDISSTADDNSSPDQMNSNCLLHLFNIANRFSLLSQFPLVDESANCQPSACNLDSDSSESSCSAENSITFNSSRRRRARKNRQHRRNLNEKRKERRMKTENKQRSFQEERLRRRGKVCDDYDWNEAAQYNSLALEKIALAGKSCSGEVFMDEGRKCGLLPRRMSDSLNNNQDGAHCARRQKIPESRFGGESGMTSDWWSHERAGGDCIAAFQSPSNQQPICVVASGSISQDNSAIFSKFSNNHQCVCISTMNIVYINSVSRSAFTQESIDNVIILGDLYYKQSKLKHGPSHTAAHLLIEEIDDTLEFNGLKFRIDQEWVTHGLYSQNADGLRIVLENVFSQDSQSGYIFLGQGAAISIWTNDDSYYMFNSHSVDRFNRYAVSGVGHVFKCRNEMELAHLLLTSANISENLPEIMSIYEIYKISPSLQHCEVVDPVVPINVMEIDSPVEISSEDEPLANLLKKTESNMSDPHILQPEEALHVLDPVDSVYVMEIDSPVEISSEDEPLASLVKRIKSNIPDPQILLPEEELQVLDPVVIAVDAMEIDSPLEKSSDDEPLINLVRRVDHISNSQILDHKLLAVPPIVLDDISRLIKNINIDINDPKLFAKAFVVLEDISENTELNKILSKNVGGRPPKTILGRPKTSDLTRIDQNIKNSGTYNKNNPDINRKTSGTYRNNNPGYNKPNFDKFKKRNPGRHLPKELRNDGLVAEYSGKKLELIKAFKLKNTSLKAINCSKCPHCKARLFDEELNRKMWCCSGGAALVTLPPLTNNLYKDEEFLHQPVRYNNFFAFSTLTIKIRGMLVSGLRFLKIKGRLYHNVHTFENSDFYISNIFIDDGNDDNLNVDNVMDKRIIRQIYALLQSCNNPYLSGYRMLHREESQEARLVFASTSRATHGPVLGDRPTTCEVAAYVSCNEAGEYSNRSVTVWKQKDKRPTQIYNSSPFLEPMSYPLLYPEGTLGWSFEMLDRNGKKLSLLKYTRCLLLSDDRFSKFNRLSETWLVDMYVRIEEERLNFIVRNQVTGHGQGLRTATADEIQANIPQDRNEIGQSFLEDETIQGEGGILPGRIYLPQTFVGSPRYMRKAYMDAMGIVSQLGGPTYFLTFTTYGQWIEIVDSKHDPRKDQPDVVDRVFHEKFRELLRDVHVVFGKMLYIVWSIEFQMRGLPHAHICFRVEDGGPTRGEDIDKIIRADIPKPKEAKGELRRLVLKHMIHGPCGPKRRTNLPCWDKNKRKCLKYFPKPHVDATYIDDRGFAQYKRNRNNKAIIKYPGKTINVDDRWVVPYNSFLLLKYQCHVNLELASAISVVKYLFKYITKGQSLRRVAVEAIPGQNDDKVDEVEEYVTQRYIGSSDAAWRVLSYDITGKEPAVIALPVHLEGKHCVIFKAGQEEQALQSSHSLLDIYFSRPNLDELKKLTYLQFYQEYIVHGSRPHHVNTAVLEHPNGKHFITKRRNPCVARLFWVTPNYIEQYYLRLLLSKFPCSGYSNLLELGGKGCRTFQEVAKAVGLAEDGSEYFQALEEASDFMFGSQLRRLFVMLLNEGALACEMWEKFSTLLAQDIIRDNPRLNLEACKKKALRDIDRVLRRHNSSLELVGLPVVENCETELSREKDAYSEKEETQTVDAWRGKLSEDQIVVFEYLQELLQNEMSLLDRVLFLDGPGGSGKTLLLRVISALFRANGKVVLCVAASGIAALNLTGGTTAHSMFRFPLEVLDTSICLIDNGTQRAELIRHASLIIYDEAPMAHKHVIEMLDRSLRDLMNKDCLFGGKIVIFSGDFRQIPPVLKKFHSSSDVVRASIRRSKIWDKVKSFQLSTHHRIAGNSEYSEFILKLGSAEVEPEIVHLGEEQFQMLVALPLLKYVDTVEELINFVFPETVLNNPDVCANRAILSTLNVNVDEINTQVCNKLSGEIVTLYSRDRVVDNNDEYHIDSSFLNHVQSNGVPNHVLKLKVGAVCLIMRNLNFDLGLVNGTKVIVERFLKSSIVCYKPNDPTRMYVIPRISFKFNMGLNSTVEMIRMQYPLKLAYAMTIHKSQGQTIDFVGLDLRTSCFTHGQLYVALSRARSPENIRLLVPEGHIVDGVAYAKNVVYSGLLKR